MAKISKKEKERVVAEARAMEVAKSLCFISEPRPIPLNYEEEKEKNGGAWSWLMVGWYCNVYLGSSWDTVRVQQGCSSGGSHSTYRRGRTESQGAGIFYRTEREAYIEARYRLQGQCAEALYRVDEMIKRLP